MQRGGPSYLKKKKDNFLLADENSLEVLGIKNKKKDYVLAFVLEGIASKILTNVQEVELQCSKRNNRT